MPRGGRIQFSVFDPVLTDRRPNIDLTDAAASATLPLADLVPEDLLLASDEEDAEKLAKRPWRDRCFFEDTSTFRGIQATHPVRETV